MAESSGSIFGFDRLQETASFFAGSGGGSGAPTDSVDALIAQTIAQMGGGSASGGGSAVGNPLAGLPKWVLALDISPRKAMAGAESGLVYMGTGSKESTSTVRLWEGTPGEGAPTLHTRTTEVEKDKIKTAEQAAMMPYTWDEGELANAMKRMQDAGLDVKTFEDVVGVWGGLVERASLTFAATKGERKLTPWDVLDLTQAEGKASGTLAEDPNRREVFTTRSVGEISEGQAWSVLQSNLSQMLGRDPSDQEVRDFTYRMNQLAAKNPSISKTITRYKNGEPVGQTTREVDPGLTAEDVAMKAYKSAQNDEMYAETQAATTYFEAALGALGAIGTT